MVCAVVMKATTYIFNKLCKIPSDINEHLETLRNYAKECDVIVEMGVCHAVSTWAFLEGMRLRKQEKENMEKSQQLLSIDINHVPDIEFVAKEAKKMGIKFKFIQQSSLDIDIPSNTNLLFIDTWHVYGQLKRELEKHHRNVSKYIIMHDTEVDKIKGECLRVKADPVEEGLKSGIPADEVSKGLGFAIVEFLETYKEEWRVFMHYPYNNGLTVLERVAPAKSTVV